MKNNVTQFCSVYVHLGFRLNFRPLLEVSLLQLTQLPHVSAQVVVQLEDSNHHM